MWGKLIYLAAALLVESTPSLFQSAGAAVTDDEMQNIIFDNLMVPNTKEIEVSVHKCRIEIQITSKKNCNHADEFKRFNNLYYIPEFKEFSILKTKKSTVVSLFGGRKKVYSNNYDVKKNFRKIKIRSIDNYNKIVNGNLNTFEEIYYCDGSLDLTFHEGGSVFTLLTSISDNKIGKIESYLSNCMQ